MTRYQGRAAVLFVLLGLASGSLPGRTFAADPPAAPAPRPKLPLFVVRSVKPADDSTTASRAFVAAYGLTARDLDAIGKLPGVAEAVPVRGFPAEVRRLAGLSNAQLRATVPAAREAFGLKLAAGRFLTDADATDRANVCVIGSKLVDDLFPFDKDGPVGKTVTVRSHEFRVVGVLEPRGGSADRDVYLPIQTAKARIGEVIIIRTAGSRTAEKVELTEIVVRVRDPKKLAAVADAARAALKKDHPKTDWEVVAP